MKQTNIFRILGILLVLLMSFGLINATQDFSVNPTIFNLNIETSSADQATLTVENTGDENINLTISKVDLVNGEDTINLNLDKTSIVGLTPSNTDDIIISYTSANIEETFIGSILVENTDNASQNTIVSVSLTITEPTVDKPSVGFKGLGSTLEMEIDVDKDNTERKTFILVNNGNTTLTDIEIDLDSTYEGDEYGDEIDDSDFEINNQDGDDTYSLKEEDDIEEFEVGDELEIDLEIKVQDSWDVDLYTGDITVSYKANGVDKSQTFNLKITATSDNEDVIIDKDALYVRNGVLEIIGEPGETIDELELTIINDAGRDIFDLEFEIEDDFDEKDSSKTMDKNVIEFLENVFDIDVDDEQDMEFEITIPDDQATGTYITDLNLLSSTGKELDTIRVEVKVIGDIYIKEVIIPDSVNPGDDLDIEITVANKGSQTYRDVRIFGSLFNVDFSNSDIFEETSSFLLDIDGERTEYLRFRIPTDARDGSATLELKIEFGDQEIIEYESIEIKRPSFSMDVESYSINPSVAKCDDSIYSYIKFRNLGQFDEDVKVTSEILGTGIKKTTSTFEVKKDESVQKNLALDISKLEAGTYDVVQSIASGSNVEKKTSILKINECTDVSIGIDIEDLDDNKTVSNESIDDNTLEIFGNEIQKTSFYLASGIGFIAILIVISLFLL